MSSNITVQKILGILLHRIKFIIAAGLVVGLLFFLYSNFLITPTYSTSTMIYVQNYNKAQQEAAKQAQQKSIDESESKTLSEAQQSNNEIAGKIFLSDINGSAQLAKICVILFRNSDKITRLYDGCNVNMAVEEGTFYVTISVTGSNPQKVANVANQIAKACPKVFSERITYGQVGVIREAYPPSAPSSPDKTKNTLIGVAIGLVAACLISILLELIDTTIKADEDLTEIYDIPVFAEIPDFESQGR